jgi:very-short-patch-repair endonuclease
MHAPDHSPASPSPEVDAAQDPLQVLHEAHASKAAPNVASACPPAPGIRRVELTIHALPCLQCALEGYGIRALQGVRIESRSDDPLRDLRLVIEPMPAFGASLEFRFDELRPGETRLCEPEIKLDRGYLERLTERIAAKWTATLYSGADVVATTSAPVTVLTPSEWPGERVFPELLATFVLPNSPSVARLLRHAGELLTEWSGSPSFDGYQRESPSAVVQQVAAIYGALVRDRIQYVSPPASFESEGQRVRLPDELETTRQGACLDLSLLAAAALEAAGVHALVVLVEGHAFCGAWLTERMLPDAVMDDVARLRNHLKNEDLLVFDPTTAVAGNGAPFEHSRGVADRQLLHDQSFRFALDVARARRARILPLATLTNLVSAAAAIPNDGSAAQISAPDTTSALAAHALRSRAVEPVERGAARIETWKRKLLDLTLRNRLLNLPTNARIVHLHVPDLARLEDQLSDGQKLLLRERPKELARPGLGATSERLEHGARTSLTQFFREQLEDGYLHTDDDEHSHEKRLVALLREANAAIEEGGASNLYLALGVLQYFETDKSERARQAPVLLIPVGLERRRASQGIALVLRPEEPRINVTLLRYIEQSHGLRIVDVDPPPQDERGLDVPLVFQRIRDQIAGKRGWEVLDRALIGMFSFSKMLILRDLEEYSERLLEGPVARHLVENSRTRFEDGVPLRAPHALDASVRSADVYVPLSADSSQLAAVVAAAEGKSFVLIGPPGTGKSQTITNLVTHCLAAGKSVLFVSEKMAALEVVHHRLCQVGLGDHCLELHSNKANKKDVLTQLGASLTRSTTKSQDDHTRIAGELDGLRARLNGYVDALHRQRASGESVYKVLTSLIGHGDGASFELGWQGIEGTTSDALERARRSILALSASAEAAGVRPDHPLLGVGPAQYSPLWERTSREQLEEARRNFETFRPLARTVEQRILAGMPLPAPGDAEPVLRLLTLLGAPRPLGNDVLVRADGSALVSEAEAALTLLERIRAEEGYFAARYVRPTGDIEHETLLAELRAAEARGWLGRFFARRRWRRSFTVRTEPKAPVDSIAARADLERLQQLAKLRASLAGHAGAAQTLLGAAWRGEATDLALARASIAWSDELRRLAKHLSRGDSDLARRLLERWSEFTGERGLPGDLLHPMQALGASWNLTGEHARRVANVVQALDRAPWENLAIDVCLDSLQRWLGAWERSQLTPWCRYARSRADSLPERLGSAVAALQSGAVLPNELPQAFERSYGSAWYEHTISTDPLLSDFNGDEHERVIEQFRELDTRLLDATRGAAQERIEAHARRRRAQVPSAQESLLRREMQKQRRHIPVRKLFAEAGDVVRALRPCLLMSPLSVAQYLDPTLPRFDVVVFDEASQMPVWDAIGAIARGKQVIVVGDPKQLPPTNFFGRADGDEGAAGEDDDEAVDDLESVLDECLASGVDEHRLAWHYRSRHEGLIAFSNREYYDGRLITFPSAAGGGLGVQLRPVMDGVYDQGKSRTNRREAEAVVAEIIRRVRATSSATHSIGVVALSQAQQSLVQDLLDDARRRDPSLEPLFEGDEPLFVKNLENVQGDERDVILLTVCYGPDAAGKVRLNFGPLNREGGWRRLNVAITRARREILVFSTLRPDQIDLARTKAKGARDLKLFLEFAERGPEAFARERSIDADAEFDSPFEVEVARALEEAGHIVRRQVGCSGYRIDLAVVDPDAPGSYLLGIECDGASYHSAPSARDRDRLRQDVLEGLGWRMHRIWSRDWWEDRRRETREVLAALDEALVCARRDAARTNTTPIDEATTDERDAAPATPESETPARYASAPMADSRVEQVAERGPARPVDDIDHTDSTSESSGVKELVAATLARLGALGRISLPRAALEIYTPATGAIVGDAVTFYDTREEARIVSVLRAVVAQEAPLLMSVAARRVGSRWGLKKVGERVLERVRLCVDAADVVVEQQADEVVLWPAGFDRASFALARVPLDGLDRPLSEVSLVELGELLRFWIEFQGPMSERVLFERAARTFGVQKLGVRVRERLTAALGRAIGSGRLRLDGAVVHAV